MTGPAKTLPGLGLLGGTFDPIHSAHIELARTARRELDLDRMFLVPAADPPLKPDHAASVEDRVAMVRLALRDEADLELCLVELEREGPSYTVDTLRTVHARFPNSTVWFVLGDDALRGLAAWHEPDQLLHLANLAVVLRSNDTRSPGISELVPSPYHREFERGPNGWRHTSGCELRLLPFTPMPLASSEIRRRLQGGQGVEDWLPESVLDYIHSHGLYQEDS